MDQCTVYERLFPTIEDKAAAFDRIAQEFYQANFGTMSKADLELLMFTIYLERTVTMNPDDMRAFSDYELSKQLAITQSRISAMKVRSALKYPSDILDWKEVFQRCAINARRDGDKLLIYVPDRTVYLEVKNAIEQNGSYAESTLTPNQLKVEVKDYVDLMLMIRGSEDRDEIIDGLKEELKKDGEDLKELNRQSFGDFMKEAGGDLAGDIVSELIPIPFLKDPVKEIVNRLASTLSSIKQKAKQQDKNKGK